MGARGTRWGLVWATGGVALLFLLLVVALLSQEPVAVSLPSSPAPTSADVPVAVVEGVPIGRNFWAEAVLLDRAMSRLAKVAAPAPQEVLDRLINEVLILRAAPQPQPEAEAVAARIAALEAAWGVSDDQVVATLGEFGLRREALEQAIARLMMVEQAQAALESQGTPIQEWLARERGRARIVTYPERMQVSFVFPTPTVTPAATSTPEGIAAPDFTLEQAGGGTLTLSEQMARGPVVLLFFQRCG